MAVGKASTNFYTPCGAEQPNPKNARFNFKCRKKVSHVLSEHRDDRLHVDPKSYPAFKWEPTEEEILKAKEASQ
jgi:hypothetical protein